MSFLIVSGESPRECRFEIVETQEQIADALARAIYGTVEEARRWPEEHAAWLKDLVEDEEISFEDGFIKLYTGSFGGVHADTLAACAPAEGNDT